MENYENENPITKDGKEMEKDDLVNQQDDSKYTPEENEFADGKGTALAEEFDAPEPEEVEDQEDLEEDLD